MAARGVNKVILVGHLGQDPDVRYMPNGGAVASLTLATSETWRDRQSGELRLANTCVKARRSTSRARCVPVAGRTIPAPRATSPRCWSGRAAPCRCSAVVVEMVSLRAPRRSSPRSRRVQPLRHNLLTLRLNPRKRRAVKKAVRAPPRLSFLLSRSRMITR